MSIHVLIKGESWLCERHLKMLLKKHVDPATKDFNFEHLSARNTKTVSVIDRLNTPPMMAPTRTVLIDDAEAWKKDDWESFLPYLKAPNPDAHLILVATKLDKRLSFYKALANVADVQEFVALKEYQIPDFVRQEATRLGLKPTDGVAEMLAEAAGPDLMTIVSELEKLKLYIHPEAKLTRQAVADLVARGVLQNIFRISGKIGRRDLVGARETFRQMCEQGESPVGIAAILVGHFRKLLLSKEGLDQRLPSAEIARLAGVPPFVFDKEYRVQCGLFPGDRLKRLYADLMKLSEALRTSRVSNETLFEDFLTRTCVSAQGSTPSNSPLQRGRVMQQQNY